jgi:hypothetical protein
MMYILVVCVLLTINQSHGQIWNHETGIHVSRAGPGSGHTKHGTLLEALLSSLTHSKHLLYHISHANAPTKVPILATPRQMSFTRFGTRGCNVQKCHCSKFTGQRK